MSNDKSLQNSTPGQLEAARKRRSALIWIAILFVISMLVRHFGGTILWVRKSSAIFIPIAAVIINLDWKPSWVVQIAIITLWVAILAAWPFS